ncbi:hypothetical protein CPT_Palo_056 [Rhizobium phage Palo]|uniref:Uncharacterized protein n=1 Tax=Rhizobium phage Palo TaxID=2767573 RepID=A0A7L8G4M0_9CAUD|nr:hypothetical protein CPT_Palo_056 [Rhizobium phage Palo]
MRSLVRTAGDTPHFAVALGGVLDNPRPVWTPDLNRYMPATTRTRWPSGFTQTYATGLNYQSSLLFFGTADYPMQDFLIPFVGFGLTEGGLAPQETVNPNAPMLLDEVFFIMPDGVTKVPILFSGAAAVSVTQATGVVHGLVSTPTPVPARSIIGVETTYHGTVGQTYIGGYRVQKHRGERYWAAADLASIRALRDARGASTADRDTFYNTVGNVSNSQPLAYGPALILAKGWDGRPVPLVVNDSLLERQGIAADADARGNVGTWRKWFDIADPVWGSTIPLVMGVPGSKSAQELATSSTLRWNMIDSIATTFNGGKPIWTFVLDQSGRNDSNATASTWANAKFGLVDRIKTRYGAGIHVVGMTLWPTVKSTTAARTVAAWSIDVLWDGVTGTLKTVNDLILASSRYAKTMDVYPAYVINGGPYPPAAEQLPLGNLVGHPGLQDGTTVWTTLVAVSGIPQGTLVTFEYQPGTWATRTLTNEAPIGNGTSTYTVIEQFATNVQDNATVYGKTLNLDSGSGTTTHVHPLPALINWIIARIPQSMKATFYP